MILNSIIYGVGGGIPYGLLIVNYPADADLTVTNTDGYEQLGVGQRLYAVKKPSSGSSVTCTATISKSGETSKSASVTFDSIGQSKSLLIEFTLSLLPPTTGWATTESASKVSIGEESITFNWSGNNGQAHTTEMIDLTGRSVLYADFVIDQESSGSVAAGSMVALGLLTNPSQTAPNWTLYASESIHNVPVGTELTVAFTLPSGIADQYYVAVGGRYAVHTTCRRVYAI